MVRSKSGSIANMGSKQEIEHARLSVPIFLKDTKSLLPSVPVKISSFFLTDENV